MNELVKKILEFIVECVKAFINIFTFGKLFKKVEKKEEKLDASGKVGD